MTAILFVAPKIKFSDALGNPGRSPTQGTCLMSLDERGTDALRRAAANGLGCLFSSA